jgi:O-antigen/teichoic acid export membrane protein
MRRGRQWLPFGWGLVDQGLSSATTFLLTVAGARAVGPRGLGVVVVGWTAYLAVLGLQRALVTRTFVAVSATASGPEQRASAERAFTLALLLGASAGAAFALIGTSLSGSVAEGLLYFAPWVVFALLQDFFRSVLFRDGRAAAAATNDGVWFTVTALAFVPAILVGSKAGVAAAWGVGAFAGTTFGFVQTRLRPDAVTSAFAWWRREAWELSRWLGSETVLYWIVATATTIALTNVLGPAAIGGLRAAQSLFAPLSLLGPAIALPGLPAIARATARSTAAGLRLAALLSTAAATLTALYIAAAVVAGGWVMPLIFGSAFDPYHRLALPIGIWQLFGATASGFSLLLTARKRGAALLAVRVVESFAIFALAVSAAARYGLRGAAWGYAAGAAAALAAVGISTYRAAGRESRGKHAAAGPVPGGARGEV